MSLKCKDLMLKENYSIRPDATIGQAFKLIKNKGVRYLPVVDENGIYKGVFTSPTLIRLLLPKSLTIDLAGHETDRALVNLNFFSIESDDFHKRIVDMENEKVIDYLSDEKNIPVTSPDTSIMEGIFLLHKYKRHVILVDKETSKFFGVLTINSVLGTIFNGEADHSYED